MLEKWTRGSVVVALALFCSLGWSGAQADSSVPYRDLIRAALQEYGGGNFVEAQSLFERAHELQPSARTLRGVGMAAFGARDYVRALVALRAALVDERKPLTPAQRRSVQRLLDRAETFVARVALETVPADVEVLVDGRRAVREDGALLLNPGVHELVVSARGYPAVARKLDAAPRAQQRLRVVLERPAPTVSPPAQVASAPPAPTPAVPPPGRARRPGLGARERVSIAALALGGAGVGLSAYFGLAARSKRDRAACEGGVCATPEALALHEQAFRFGRASTALAVVGGAALGAAAWVYFARPGTDKTDARARGSQASLRLLPVLSPRFGGALLRVAR